MKRIRENEERQLLSSKNMEIRVSYTVTSRTFVCQTSPRHKGFVEDFEDDIDDYDDEDDDFGYDDEDDDFDYDVFDDE